jgi:ATP phosphoribosyltransferase
MCQENSFDLEGRLLFAVPKKGRIYDQSVALLKNIGISVCPAF